MQNRSGSGTDGCLSRTRTYDQAVNSRSLYQLSYQAAKAPTSGNRKDGERYFQAGPLARPPGLSGRISLLEKRECLEVISSPLQESPGCAVGPRRRSPSAILQPYRLSRPPWGPWSRSVWVQRIGLKWLLEISPRMAACARPRWKRKPGLSLASTGLGIPSGPKRMEDGRC